MSYVWLYTTHVRTITGKFGWGDGLHFRGLNAAFTLLFIATGSQNWIVKGKWCHKNARFFL